MGLLFKHPSSIKLPTCWEELTSEQFLEVVQILDKNQEVETAMHQILWCLTQTTPEEYTSMDPEYWEQFFPDLEWIKTQKWVKSFLPSFGRWPFKRIGPLSGLENFSFNQFMWVEDMVQTWLENENDQALLNRIMNVLYVRGQFNSKWVDVKFKAPLSWKKAAVVNYLGIRQFLAEEMYPNVFSGGGSSQPTALNHWAKLIDDLAGPKHGSPVMVGKSNLHHILADIQNSAERNEETPESDNAVV